ncbi:MAG: glycosyltransferase [Proteobacteria bacterium]|nr:glycosyltransferase [Pseudomonadota bacterium]
MTKPLKILHCPATVGGHPQQLAISERELGLDSHSATLEQNYLQYPVDEVVFGRCKVLNELRRWRFVARALRRYDVIHYNFGSSIMAGRVDERGGVMEHTARKLYNLLYGRHVELRDVAQAHKLGKVIAVTYQGDDARQGDFCRAHYPIHFAHELEASGYYSRFFDQVKREKIAAFDRHADLIYALNPDLLNVLPQRARFLPYANVDLRQWAPTPPESDLGMPHVVHAPTHRKVKGSEYIVAALERLKAEGVPFKYTLVEGVPRARAREVYETADLAVDQILSGFYGGLAVELMALGKPVICYLRQEDLRFLPQEMRQSLPIINAEPATIYEVLKTWLTTRKMELRAQGLLSRAYMERWHDPLKIAASIKRDYETACASKPSRRVLE